MHTRAAHDSVQVWRVYQNDWRLLRSDFSSFKLFFYAVTWARSIFVGTTKRKTDEDGAEVRQTEAYVCNVSCATRMNADKNKELVFIVPGDIPRSWRAGNTVVLSRSNPCEDGLWNYTMKIECIRWPQFIVLETRNSSC